MRIKWFHLIPATLLSFCSACATPNEKGATNEDFSRKYVLSEEFFEGESGEESKNILPVPTFWDTSAVDLSDVDESRKLISFTFDDAPSSTLERILALFASFNDSNPTCKASATVFFNGYRFDGQTKHLLYAACALGFELGNHTYSHADLTTLTADALREEIDRTDELLFSVDGQKRHLLRAPFGRLNAQVKEAAYTPIIDWTIDTLDWTGASEEEIYNRVFQNRFSGAIVLMHDGYGHTVSALKRLLPDLAADGYQVVSVSKMIKAHGCNFRNGGVYIRARNQNE